MGGQRRASDSHGPRPTDHRRPQLRLPGDRPRGPASRPDVAGALLVAPADPAKFDLGDELFSRPLQFPSTLVASTNDPWLKFVTAGALAAQWGSDFVSAGPAGHINAETGHGHWPAGLALLRDLAERAAAAGTLRDAGPRRGAPT